VAKDARACELISLGDKLFTDKRQLDSLSQEIAWQFCPDLASFTTKLVLGQDFAIDRMDSSPEQVSRELSNQLSAMLRPTDRDWFKVTTLDEEIDADEANARYLEYIGRTIRQGLYDPRSKFIRATKLADRYYVNFGMAVLSVEEASKTRDHLFFRCFHLKNCAWIENDTHDVDHLHRKETMTARAMLQTFSGAGDSLAPEIKRAAEKEPSKEFDIRVVTMPAAEYDLTSSGQDGGRVNRRDHPFIVSYVDAVHGKVIRERPAKEFMYVVPRWNMFADSAYAFSPCSMIALPDARMAQMMNQILLEAGEKAVDPPLVAKAEIVIGEPNLQAGGISWIDMEHDDTLKNALDAIHLSPDMKVGFEMRKDLREVLAKAFFIDKLALPEPSSKMTAYEVGRRLEEHVRNLLPLFEPMQIEYNSRVLDKSYNTLLNMNKFHTDGRNGTPPMPAALRAVDVTWAFQSPIQDAMERIMVEYFKGSLELVQLGMQAGAKASPLNVDKALKDAVRGTGAPASWRMTVDEMAAQAQQIAQQKAEQTQMAAIGQGAQIAEHGGKAAAHLAGAAQTAGLLPPPSQKAVQGSAQGAPEQAGAMGLNPADAGDQGQPANENEAAPPPWLPQQPAAVLAGGQGQGGAQPGQPQQQTPSQPAGPPVSELMRMLRSASLRVQELEDKIDRQDKIDRPRTVTIHRDAKGKITGATASIQEH
jgi:hypothetical protein